MVFGAINVEGHHKISAKLYPQKYCARARKAWHAEKIFNVNNYDTNEINEMYSVKKYTNDIL